MTIQLFCAATMMLLSMGLARADDDRPADDAYIAAKSAEIETMRARLGVDPSATASATLIEAEDLLRRLRQTPPAKQDAGRSQLDAALARLGLELSADKRK